MNTRSSEVAARIYRAWKRTFEFSLDSTELGAREWITLGR